ncbi:MAG: hypothetical protein ACHQ50_09900 [Fimbriimonadales bacterium]
MLLPTLSLALTIGPQTDAIADRAVTFETVAEPASQALKQFGNAAGVPMSTDGAVAPEMLILRFKDVPLRQAMDKIAEIATAKWMESPEGYKLVRPASMVAEILEKARKEREEVIERRLRARLADLPQFSPNWARVLLDQIQQTNSELERTSVLTYSDDQGSLNVDSGLMNRLEFEQPWGRFETRLLAALGAHFLSSLSPGRTVLSTSPTRMQQALPEGTLQLATEFVRQQNLWHKTEFPVEPAEPDFGTLMVGSGMRIRQVGLNTSKVEGVPMQCLLVLEPQPESDDVRAEVTIADSKGIEIASDSADLEPGSWGSFGPGFELDLGPQTQDDQEAKIRLSKAAQQIHDIEFREDSDKPLNRLLPEAASYLLHPEQNEPLALFPSEPILRAAEAKSLNVAACVEDSSFDATLEDDLTPSSILATAMKQLGQVKKEAGWLTIKPTNPLSVFHESRGAAGQFARNVVRDGRATLENLALYSLSVKDSSGGLGIWLAGTILRDVQGLSDGINDFDSLRLYGALAPSDQASLVNGGSLTVEAMSATQRSIVSQIVYGSRFQGGEAPDDLPEATTELLRRFDASEPTSVLAQGLVPGISLTIGAEYTPVLYVTTRNGDGDVTENQERGVDGIAQDLLDAREPPKKDTDEKDSGPPPQVLGYRWGVHRAFTLKLALPLWHEDSGGLQDTEMHAGPLLSFDQLPDSIKTAISDKIEEIRKGQDDNGGGDPPPGITWQTSGAGF